MDLVRTQNSEIWTEGEILMARLSGVITADEIERMTKISREMAYKSGAKYGIVDMSDVTDAPFGTRKADPSSFTGPVKKAALVCSSHTSRIVSYFLLKRYEIPIPTKIFSDVGGAKKWFSEK
jgi:hypothetical protein